MKEPFPHPDGGYVEYLEFIGRISVGGLSVGVPMGLDLAAESVAEIEGLEEAA